MLMAGSLSLMIAAPRPGRAGVQLDPTSPGHHTSIQLTGKVTAKNGKYLLTEEKKHLTVELRGTDLERYAGKTVTVTGEVLADAIPVPGATEVVLISDVGIVVGKAGVAAAGVKTGLSGAKIAVFGTTAAVAGTLGGLYASGAIQDDKPASRP